MVHVNIFFIELVFRDLVYMYRTLTVELEMQHKALKTDKVLDDFLQANGLIVNRVVVQGVHVDPCQSISTLVKYVIRNVLYDLTMYCTILHIVYIRIGALVVHLKKYQRHHQSPSFSTTFVSTHPRLGTWQLRT